ncbi:hypothetical protein TRVL_02026 [Trypanosoma vivax]|nr:hypothetical protein TRVL_02026 [Trypanosoma vivax]
MTPPERSVSFPRLEWRFSPFCSSLHVPLNIRSFPLNSSLLYIWGLTTVNGFALLLFEERGFTVCFRETYSTSIYWHHEFGVLCTIAFGAAGLRLDASTSRQCGTVAPNL